jgi:hypothetical protein
MEHPVGSPQYYELLNKYNTLLKMYRSRPVTQQIRKEMPRCSARDYDVQARLPALQQQYPDGLANLQKYADRLNVPFNAGDLTNTSEYGFGDSVLKEYKGLQKELGMSTSGSKKKKKKNPKKAKSHSGMSTSGSKKKKKKKTQKATSHSGGRSKRNRRTHRKR